MGDVIEFFNDPSGADSRASNEMDELKRILHVDDDEDIREIAKMSLELLGGFEVTQFESAQDMLDNIEDCDPQIILLDVMMPDMSGEELWMTLRELPKFASVPTVFFTAKADREYQAALLEKGAAGVIVKPFDPEALCSNLKEIWTRSQRTRPS